MTVTQQDLLTDGMLPLQWEQMSARRFDCCHPVSGRRLGSVMRVGYTDRKPMWFAYWRADDLDDFVAVDSPAPWSTAGLARAFCETQLRALGFEVQP